MAIEYTKEGKVAVVRINRPEVLNAINLQDLRELSRVMTDFRDDPELWVAILTGTGDKAFSAGADLRETVEVENQGAYVDQWKTVPMIHRGLDIWKPLIAAVNGWALGSGLEIALACDIMIASENARFGNPEVKWGLIPGDGATQRLTRMLPWRKASEIILTGRPIDAREAYRIGLVNQVVPQNRLMDAAREWAQLLCEAAPLAVRAAKEAMAKGYNMPLKEGLQLELSLEKTLHFTEDYHEGSRAFLEKRKPDYKAR